MNNLPQVFNLTEQQGKNQLALATNVAKSGLYPSITKPEQAIAIIQTGMEMGLSPMESFQSLYIVNGNVNIWGSALVRRFRDFKWQIKWDKVSEIEVTVTVSKDGETYTETARKAEVEAGKAYKYGHKENKLRYHALRKIARFCIPEILGPLQNVGEDIVAYQKGRTPVENVEKKLDKFDANIEDAKPEPVGNEFIGETTNGGRKVKTVTDKGVKEIFRLIKEGEWNFKDPYNFHGIHLIPELAKEILSVLPEWEQYKKEKDSQDFEEIIASEPKETKNTDKGTGTITAAQKDMISTLWRKAVDSGKVDRKNSDKIFKLTIQKYCGTTELGDISGEQAADLIKTLNKGEL